ncbi:hypothetical protein MNBD_NITROSPINAE01-443 [hydrothermal vent metagenome]|uniref:AB hydrolase-1 domain-containing protein n=1 Tax=hydrothermal vent metagenome TaxID=652676 RepID=A0A3B1BU78_9ZZZZ
MEQKPLLIMVHGWGQTKRAFDPLVELLAQKLRVITFDLPGHGEAKNSGGPFTFERYRNELSEVVKTSGASSFHLLGWSMGGTISAGYCLEKTGVLPKSLTLLSATPKFVTHTHNLGIGQHPAGVKKMERQIDRDTDSGLRNFIDSFFDSGEQITQAQRTEIENLFYSNNFPPNQEALLSSLSELASTDLTISKKRFNEPVLLIYGRMDRICPVGGQALWKKLFERVDELCLENTGHAPHLTQTAQVAESIASFILKQE